MQVLCEHGMFISNHLHFTEGNTEATKATLSSALPSPSLRP